MLPPIQLALDVPRGGGGGAVNGAKPEEGREETADFPRRNSRCNRHRRGGADEDTDPGRPQGRPHAGGGHWFLPCEGFLVLFFFLTHDRGFCLCCGETCLMTEAVCVCPAFADFFLCTVTRRTEQRMP